VRSGLDRDVCAGPDRETEVGLGERRRVVDAIPYHRHDLARVLEAADLRYLLVGQDPGDDAVDADFGRHALCRLLGVPRQEDGGQS
jgi:hypothetical protein